MTDGIVCHQLDFTPRCDQVGNQKLQIRRQIDTEYHIGSSFLEDRSTIEQLLHIVFPWRVLLDQAVLLCVHHYLSREGREVSLRMI